MAKKAVYLENYHGQRHIGFSALDALDSEARRHGGEQRPPSRSGYSIRDLIGDGGQDVEQAGIGERAIEGGMSRQ